MMSPPLKPIRQIYAASRRTRAAPKQMCVLGEIISSSCVQCCFIAHTKTNEKQLCTKQQSHCEKVRFPLVPSASSGSKGTHNGVECQPANWRKIGKLYVYQKKSKDQRFLAFHGICFPSLHQSTQGRQGAEPIPAFLG